MAISTEDHSIEYAGNANALTPYVIPFPFLEPAHIVAYVDGVLRMPDTYTVTLSEGGGGGLLFTNDAVGGGSVLRIDRVTARKQPTAFQLNGPFPSKAVETALDRLTMMVQEVFANFRLIATSYIVGIEEFSGLIQTPSPGSYTLILDAKYSSLLTQASFKTGVGSASVTIGGVTANVTTAKSTFNINTAVTMGSSLVLTINTVTSATNLAFTLKFRRL